MTRTHWKKTNFFCGLSISQGLFFDVLYLFLRCTILPLFCACFFFASDGPSLQVGPCRESLREQLAEAAAGWGPSAPSKQAKVSKRTRNTKQISFSSVGILLRAKNKRSKSQQHSPICYKMKQNEAPREKERKFADRNFLGCTESTSKGNKCT